LIHVIFLEVLQNETDRDDKQFYNDELGEKILTFKIRAGHLETGARPVCCLKIILIE
jgi:hypothetical protein